jgi:hypothetical protein
MRKSLMIVLGITSIAAFAYPLSGNSMPRKCDQEFAACQKAAKGKGLDGYGACLDKHDQCTGENYRQNPFQPGRSWTPGRGPRSTGEMNGKEKTPGKDKGKGKRREAAPAPPVIRPTPTVGAARTPAGLAGATGRKLQ